MNSKHIDRIYSLMDYATLAGLQITTQDGANGFLHHQRPRSLASGFFKAHNCDAAGFRYLVFYQTPLRNAWRFRLYALTNGRYIILCLCFATTVRYYVIGE